MSLKRDLGSGDPHRRIEALKRIRSEGDAVFTDAVEDLALRDPVPFVRAEAIEALVVLRRPTSLQVLGEIFRKDSIPYVRWKAVCALGRLGDRRALSFLLEALDDADPDVAWQAAESLGMVGDPRALPRLREALFHSDPYVQEKAAEALGRIGDGRAVPWLEAMVRDEDLRYSEDHQRFLRKAAEALDRLRDSFAETGERSGPDH